MHTAPLRELTTATGPFASIYFDSSHDTEDAAKQLELRWRALRDQLAADGAPESLLSLLDDAVASGPPAVGRSGRAIIANADGVQVDRVLAEPPPRSVVRYSPLPYLLPLARHSAQPVSHVVALVDSTGANLRAVDRNGETLATPTVRGEDHPVHKARAGGEAHRSMQKHAEETVKHNITDVAHEVDQLVSRVGARTLVIAGEVQARRALRDALSPRSRDMAHELDSNPDTGRLDEHTDLAALDDEVNETLAQQRNAQLRDLVERFHAEFERDGGLAVQGLDQAIPVLRTANAATVLISDPQVADRLIWAGTDPAQVALHESDELGTGEPSKQRADEAIPMAAIAVNAELVCEPDELALTDGIGVLLRHP
ncbi:MAG: peptide chain release factor 2 [Pseudonocardiaceae bacterium]|nr:peptide chain release factor 2 [Pseudonocardiaceae bacterium]